MIYKDSFCGCLFLRAHTTCSSRLIDVKTHFLGKVLRRGEELCPGRNGHTGRNSSPKTVAQTAFK